MAIAACLMMAPLIWAGNFQVLYSFPSNSSPWSALAQGMDGALYGTTLYDGPQGDGSVFRVTTNGIFTNLIFFEYSNGAHPFAGLLPGDDGALYGTTATGGPGGYGTVFRITTDGSLATIGSFSGANGQSPRGLTRGRDGLLYGTTVSGGAYVDGYGHGYGTVFRVATNGTLTNLVSFAATNGWEPLAGLVQGPDGAFYGTTLRGGANTDTDTNGYGTVFKVTTNGMLTTLVSFAGTNGAHPFAPLALGRDGMFYGTTEDGGAGDVGTVFGVSSTGVLRTLASIAGSGGLYPGGGLVEGNDGALYGTTTQGTFSPGTFGGTVFRVTTNRLFSSIYSFAEADGRWPEGELIRSRDGAFYGTCVYGGGPQNGGTVFRLDPTIQICPLNRQGTNWEITFSGLPRSSYGVVRATNAGGPWRAASTVTAGANGMGSWLDSSPALDRGFYRIVIP